MEEALVIATVRAGNIDAFGEIIERYEVGVVRYLLRLTGNYRLIVERVAEDRVRVVDVEDYHGN